MLHVDLNSVFFLPPLIHCKLCHQSDRLAIPLDFCLSGFKTVHFGRYKRFRRTLLTYFVVNQYFLEGFSETPVPLYQYTCRSVASVSSPQCLLRWPQISVLWFRASYINKWKHQLDATILSVFFTAIFHSTCFGCHIHPSSGASNMYNQVWYDLITV